jgi:hypothetical protein
MSPQVARRWVCACVAALPVGMAHLRAAEPVTAPLWTAAETGKGYVVFEHPTLERMPSTYVPERNEVTDKLTSTLARGEYESVQFGVHAIGGDLQNIRVTVTSDLEVTLYRRRSEFTVPAAPAATAADLDKRVGSPSEWMYLQRGNAVERLPAGVSVNFWVTLHAAPDAAPGSHAGKILVEIDGKPATELTLAAEVRPFELAPASIPFGMYYARGMYNKGDDAPHAVIYRDMAAHGQNTVTFYLERDCGGVDFAQVPPKGTERLAAHLAMARDAGLVRQDIPCIVLQHNILAAYAGNHGLDAAPLQAVTAWLQTQHRENGWPEIMVYSQDEPPYEAPGLREAFGPLRTLPIRVTTAMSAQAAYAYGDIHDVWIVHDGHITPELQAEAERRGAQVWTYTYRLWRQSYNPLIQRYFAGFCTWAIKLRGNCVWEYYYGYNWVDPASKETMPTTGWEARREGVDDYRYLQMLEDAIQAKPDDPLAIEAAVWLERLRARILSNPNQDKDGYWDKQTGFPPSISRVEPHLVDAGKPLGTSEFDSLRSTAAGYIARLGPAAPRPAAAATYVKDEAAPYRGKSVEQCLAGLQSPDVREQRAAAWALFELGPKAAAAVPALIAALEKPEVRIPALRALEMIGPEAQRAAPRIAALLSHPDDFIRQGATTALARICPPAPATPAP